MAKQRSLSGKSLNKLWDVGAKHALYREDGRWYHQLRDFPGALFDANGFIIFETEQEYVTSPYLQIKQDLHITDGISSIPGYVRVTEANQLQHLSQAAKKVSEKENSYDVSNKPRGHENPKKNIIEIERTIRDTRISSWVKYVHNAQCQICGLTLRIGSNKFYAEAHHIKPLGHNGPDVVENIICVCPNHHALLDLGVIELKESQLHHIEGHQINSAYIDYHNRVILKKFP